MIAKERGEGAKVSRCSVVVVDRPGGSTIANVQVAWKENMKILIAEDCRNTAKFYKQNLEDRGHEVTVTSNGEECLKVYHDNFQTVYLYFDAMDHIQPFDIVIIDYDLPRINGLEVAKEILTVNRRQRIVFTSSEYLKDTILESIEKLNRLVEVITKPFNGQTLVDTIEDKSIYSELKNMNVDIDLIKKANLRHEQLKDTLELLRKIQNR
jgi:CheY-like chemotaxis protein